MFTLSELKTLHTILRGGGYLTTAKDHLVKKIGDAIKDGNGGPYRGTLARISDDDFSWVENEKDDELVEQMLITKEQKVVAAKGLMTSLERRNDELIRRLEGLSHVEAIAQENERLTLELAAVGPPEAKEEIEILKRAAETQRQTCEVLQHQVEALSKALREERLSRQQLETWRRPTLTIEAEHNIARLTGACTCSDTQKIDPDCPKHRI